MTAERELIDEACALLDDKPPGAQSEAYLMRQMRVTHTVAHVLARIHQQKERRNG